MKCLIFVALIGMTSFTVNAGDALSGEHLNGVRYERYTGPEVVRAELLGQVFVALDSYARLKTDGGLARVLADVREKEWRRVGFENLTVDVEQSAAHQIRIGVRYDRGDLQCVFYENQIVAGYGVSTAEGEAHHLYYLRGDGEILVTDAYTMHSSPFTVR